MMVRSSKQSGNSISFVKQAVALQTGLGQGGGLNRNFSKASGMGARPVSSALRTVQRLTQDKRPVSGHVQMRP